MPHLFEVGLQCPHNIAKDGPQGGEGEAGGAEALLQELEQGGLATLPGYTGVKGINLLSKHCA